MAVKWEWYHECGYVTLKGKRIFEIYGGGNCDLVCLRVSGNHYFLEFWIDNAKQAQIYKECLQQDFLINKGMHYHLNVFDKRSTKDLMGLFATMESVKVTTYRKDWTKTRRYKSRMKAIKEGRY